MALLGLDLGFSGGSATAGLTASTPLTSDSPTIINFGQGNIAAPTENQIGQPSGANVIPNTVSALTSNPNLTLYAAILTVVVAYFVLKK
jgi:hypothetical protein